MAVAVAMVAMVDVVDMVAMVMAATAHCAIEDTGLMASTEEFLTGRASKYFHIRDSYMLSKRLSLGQNT